MGADATVQVGQSRTRKVTFTSAQSLFRLALKLAAVANSIELANGHGSRWQHPSVGKRSIRLPSGLVSQSTVVTVVTMVTVTVCVTG